MEKEEIKYINYQLIGLGLTLITTAVAILITYNRKLGVQKKEKILSSENTLLLTKWNRIVILSIGILFLYINYQLYLIQKKRGSDLKSSELQIVASIFVIISELIALYVISLSSTETIADVENPNI